MKLIIGLGNPGKRYIKTRHNIGWLILDELVNQEQLITNNQNSWQENKKAKALYLKTKINGQPVELLKPQTFMNDSGYSVAQAAKNHNLDVKTDIIVIHDDKDIALGKIKVQIDRSSAGHKGVQSIIQQLGTQNFTRLRVGIANANQNQMREADKFVLSKFGLLEKKKLKQAINEAVEKIRQLI